MDGFDQRSTEAGWQFAGLGLAMFLGIVVAVVGIARTCATGPGVGDVVALRSGAALPDALRDSFAVVRLDARGQRGAPCALEPEVMARDGGSLVVEEKRPGTVPSYLVHWAGGNTSGGPRDCGRSADLEMTARELAQLALIAGGYGVEGAERPSLLAVAQ